MATTSEQRRGGTDGGGRSDGRSARADAGIQDLEYDLISTVYHNLQGMEAAAKYALDAEEEGSPEIAEFFRATQREYQQRAGEARQLLKGRK